MSPSVAQSGQDARASELRTWRLINSALSLLLASWFAGAAGAAVAAVLAFLFFLRPEIFKRSRRAS
jgi:hypothetical protein